MPACWTVCQRVDEKVCKMLLRVEILAVIVNLAGKVVAMSGFAVNTGRATN